MSPARKQATYADLVALPEGVTGQIIAGELIAAPRPAGDHAITASSLGVDLGSPFMRGKGGPGGWWIVVEPELHLGADVLVPDLAGWRREQLPEYPAGPGVTLRPDWICEVLSPSTAAIDRVRKLPIYAREGVPHAWIIDPVAHTLEVFALTGRQWVVVATHEGDGPVRAVPFDAVELTLRDLWRTPTTPTAP